jgi:SAM-dependent methyltransferase
MWGAEYVGSDIAKAKEVSVICDVANLTKQFGTGKFDVVLCMDTMEHVADWRTAATQLKLMLAEGGDLIVAAPSKGFPFHGWPSDYWRYSEADMKEIFGDLKVVETFYMAADAECGIHCMRKAGEFSPKDLSGIALYSIRNGHRSREVPRGARAAVSTLFQKGYCKFRQFFDYQVWKIGAFMAGGRGRGKEGAIRVSTEEGPGPQGASSGEVKP